MKKNKKLSKKQKYERNIKRALERICFYYEYLRKVELREDRKREKKRLSKMTIYDAGISQKDYETLRLLEKASDIKRYWKNKEFCD